jgi:hypothetical protein
MSRSVRLAAVCATALVVLAAGCSSSGSTELTCGAYLDAQADARRDVVASTWVAGGGRSGEAPPTDDVDERCRQTSALPLGDVLESVAAAAASTPTTGVAADDDDVLRIRAVRQVIPVVGEGGGGPSGALVQISQDCVAESVGPDAVAAEPDERVVVAGDHVCYRLGPVLFATTAVGAVAADVDANGAARRITVQLRGADVDRFVRLTEDAAAHGELAPIGQLAFLLNGALLDVVDIEQPVADGAVVLQASDDTFELAVVETLQGMIAAP